MIILLGAISPLTEANNHREASNYIGTMGLTVRLHSFKHSKKSDAKEGGIKKKDDMN